MLRRRLQRLSRRRSGWVASVLDLGGERTGGVQDMEEVNLDIESAFECLALTLLAEVILCPGSLSDKENPDPVAVLYLTVIHKP